MFSPHVVTLNPPPPPNMHGCRRYLHGLADGGRAVAGGSSDDGVRHARPSSRMLSGAVGVAPPQGDMQRKGGRRGVPLAVGAEGAVGGGQRGGLAPGAEHGGGPLQAERLQLLAGRGGQAVRDLGLWPDLQENQNFSQDPESKLLLSLQNKSHSRTLYCPPLDRTCRFREGQTWNWTPGSGSKQTK